MRQHTPEVTLQPQTGRGVSVPVVGSVETYRTRVGHAPSVLVARAAPHVAPAWISTSKSSSTVNPTSQGDVRGAGMAQHQHTRSTTHSPAWTKQPNSIRCRGARSAPCLRRPTPRDFACRWCRTGRPRSPCRLTQGRSTFSSRVSVGGAGRRAGDEENAAAAAPRRPTRRAWPSCGSGESSWHLVCIYAYESQQRRTAAWTCRSCSFEYCCLSAAPRSLVWPTTRQGPLALLPPQSKRPCLGTLPNIQGVLLGSMGLIVPTHRTVGRPLSAQKPPNVAQKLPVHRSS